MPFRYREFERGLEGQGRTYDRESSFTALVCRTSNASAPASAMTMGETATLLCETTPAMTTVIGT